MGKKNGKPKAKPKAMPRMKPAIKIKPNPEVINQLKKKSAERSPSRHRTMRCEKCRAYLFGLELLQCEPGSIACVLVSLKCRNKKCKHDNQVTIDLENTDQ